MPNLPTLLGSPCLLVVLAQLGVPDNAPAQASQAPVAVQRFGWETPDGGGSTATAAQKRLDGGMLSRVSDIAESSDGTLYVLDGAVGKVVVFNPDGTVRRIIGNGKGEGPGEFVAANSLTLSDAGELFVLDLRLARITVFDTAGKVRRTLPIGMSGLLQVRADRDRLYLLRAMLGPGKAVLVLDHAGKQVDRLHDPTSEDQQYGRTGNGYRLARLRDGSWVVANPNPGTWAALDAPGRRFGVPVVPDNEVLPERGTTVLDALARLRGFGQLADGRHLVFFDRRNRASFTNREATVITRFLAVLSAQGRVIRTIPMDDAGNRMIVARNGTDFFIQSDDPFPQVVRYRL